jgi:hypothetical protein
MMAETHNFAEYTPVTVTHHTIEAIFHSDDRGETTIAGFAVVKVTRGLHSNGDVAFVDRKIVAGSVIDPLTAAEARRALAGIGANT